MKGDKSIQVGVYVEDDPHTMREEVFIQPSEGEMLLCGGSGESRGIIFL